MKCAHFTCHVCAEPHEDPKRTEYVVGLEREVERLQARIEEIAKTHTINLNLLTALRDKACAEAAWLRSKVAATMSCEPDDDMDLIEAVRLLVKECDDARAEVERLRGALRESCDLTDEALGYAPDYFKVKWGLPEAAARIRREGGLTDE